MVVTISSHDGHVFRIDSEVAIQCGYLHAHPVDKSGMLLDYDVQVGSVHDPIVVPNMSSWALTKVLDWCTHHRSDELSNAFSNDPRSPYSHGKSSPTDVCVWDAQFIELSNDGLCELLLAADRLDVPPLIYLATRTLYVELASRCSWAAIDT